MVRSFVMLCISFFLYSVIFPRDYRWNAHWGNASGFFLRLDYEIGAAGSGIGLPRVLLGVESAFPGCCWEWQYGCFWFLWACR